MQIIPNLQKFLEDYDNYSPRLDAFLNALIRGKTGRWLAGGALRRSILEGNPSSDWDVFFNSRESYDRFVNECHKFGLRDIKQTANNSQFTITLKVGEKDEEFLVQAIIIQFYSSPEAIITSFDFTICQFATDGQALYSSDTALFDLGRKRLVVNQISFPVASLRRLLKYSNQGFYACSGCLNDLLSSVAQKPELLNQQTQYVD